MFTYEEVLEAYIKLKANIYYDSSNLFIRKQLAIFETDLHENLFVKKKQTTTILQKYNIVGEEASNLELYERKLKAFTIALNEFHEDPSYFHSFFKLIRAKLLPKKIQENAQQSRIISNKRTAGEYPIERSLVFFDAPIEVHLIAILWIMQEGYKLDAELDNSCYGNRLLLNKNKSGVVKGSALFKPYQRQYQRWRDDSVECSKKYLDSGTNVMLLNLDIRDFFYSVRIPRADLETRQKKARYSPQQWKSNLIQLFVAIHEKFTTIVAQELKVPYDFSNEVFSSEGEVQNFILPIGLLSSFVLANHHLLDFDQRILTRSKPAYYGRYVDDILMVLINPVVPGVTPLDTISELNFSFDNYRNSLMEEDWLSDEHLSEKNYEKLFDLERIVLENFNPIITLIDKPYFLSKRDDDLELKIVDRLFKINGYKRLYCQSEKTLLYYFDKDESSLVIDKLKRDLEEKSSEFRNYEDTDDEGDFVESAYHLLYDGTEGKIRTLKDYKEDRFGLTVFLTKKIFSALRTTDKISDLEADKLVKFFKGINTLTLYTLWERVFVYLLVNDNAKAYVDFYINCVTAILAINASDTVDLEDTKYRKSVLEYLHCAHEITLSLDPSFISRHSVAKQTYEFHFNMIKVEDNLFEKLLGPLDETTHYIIRYRVSNLIRHHFVARPMFSYTVDNKHTRNLTSLTINYDV